MSSLIERLQAARAEVKPQFVQWLEKLPAEDRKALENAAADHSLSSKKLLTIVRAEGGSIGESQFKEWRVKHGFAG